MAFSFQRAGHFACLRDRSRKTGRDDLRLSTGQSFRIGLASRDRAEGLFLLRRKEVIHPLVLEGIPCFDLTPITGPALDAVPLAVGQTLSGLAGSHGVTGSVYKARERIHRGSADPRLLAIPASRSRIADSDPYWGRLSAIRFTSRCRNALYRPL